MKHLQLKNPHFIKIHRQFAQRKKDEGRSASHVNSVANHSKEFFHYLECHGHSDLKKIRQQTITDYFHYLEHRPNRRRAGTLSPAYLNKHREAVLRFFEFLYGLDIGQCPFFIRKYRTDNIPKDILTEGEVKQLFDDQGNDMDGIRNKAILGILYGCGLRKGELHRLDVPDIDFNRNTLRVRRSKTFTQRDVPIGPTVKKYLEEYLYGVREPLLPDHREEYAFLLNNCGDRMSLGGIQHKVGVIARASGIQKPITAHRLRHAIATHLVDHASIEEIALFLGHSNLESSQIYTHVKHTKLPWTISKG